jgi:hypothetical protein
MILVYKNTTCPLCKGHHDLWLEDHAHLTYSPHEFVCPTLNQRTQWRPDVFGHTVKERPADAVALTACGYESAAR